MGKIDRREFWVRLLAPVAAALGIGNRYKIVNVPRCYMMAGPTIPGAKYVFKDPVLNSAAESLGRKAAEKIDKEMMEVLKRWNEDYS